ncbi:MAG: hypothetical protein ACREH4_05355 [Vitreimonas sp.]
MSPSQTKATFRMVAASFAAGASAMALFGLVAPVAVQGGLSVRDAIALPEAQEQLIEPLDVASIEAQLAKAQAEMDASRARTDGDMRRLERLSGR